MNWLEQYAIEDEEFRKHGGAVWREFKLACRTIVESFNRIYGHPERPLAVFGDCADIDLNCFNVRVMAMARTPERVLDAWFKPEGREITFTLISAESIPKLSIGAKGKPPDGLSLYRVDDPVTVTRASQLVLEPFLFPSGKRPLPVNPPVV